MKTIYETKIGGDGGLVGAYVGEGALIVKASYPLTKIAEPLLVPIDSAFKAIESAIPGDWDVALLEPIKVSLKAEIMKLLAE